MLIIRSRVKLVALITQNRSKNYSFQVILINEISHRWGTPVYVSLPSGKKTFQLLSDQLRTPNFI